MYRQGDVLVVPVNQIPAECRKVPRERGRVILAHGEVTGHAHAIKDRAATLYEETSTGDRFLVLEADGSLTHEEHATIPLSAGSYRVVRQREYSPEEIRNVAD